MKESEAKRRICIRLLAALIPHYRSEILDKDGNNDAMILCKGSECMMWKEYPVTLTSTTEEKPSAEWEETDTKDHPVKWFKKVHGGDCGLNRGTFKKVGNVEILE